MNAVRQATSSMLTPMEANTTMAISRPWSGSFATDTLVDVEVVFRLALLVAVISAKYVYPYCNSRPETSWALGAVLASRVIWGVTGVAVGVCGGVCRSLREAAEGAKEEVATEGTEEEDEAGKRAEAEAEGESGGLS